MGRKVTFLRLEAIIFKIDCGFPAKSCDEKARRQNQNKIKMEINDILLTVDNFFVVLTLFPLKIID
jgi:hypothetical protein